MSMISDLVKKLRWIADYEYQNRNSEVTIRKAADTIEMLSEKARATEQEWIPCSERLPEYLDTVLLSTFHGVRLGFRDHTDAYGDYWDLIDVDSTTTSQYVYAWMELPEPYEPKEADE